MSSVSFSIFAEPMDHEFTTSTISIKKIGYKVDGTGIKTHCSCHTLKSVDYFHEDEGDITLIEFSDLEAQNAQILSRIEKLKNSGMAKSDVVKFVKELHRTIPNEMRKKFLDSIHILRCMNDSISDIPEWAANREKGKYIIVVAPIAELAPPEQKADLVRLLDKLKSQLTLSIPDPLFKGVNVLPLDRFIQN
ncbi:hypothetical protein [Enterobacter cloacae]|uniref:hypothetical protein n=1 Tax=Enterobacter cloacae TaxID=550 RepID=UPI002B1F3A1A|nr:hypothetical protein [Enterobacter cloacae]MEA5216195.1 hypothetical protein [Enterobacter cloacae]